MKRHYHGPGHGISTESLSFTEVQVSSDEDKVERVTTLLSVEARICPEPVSLCLRIQHWAMVSSTKSDKILSKTNFVTICDHLTAYSSTISRLIQSRLDARHTELNPRVRQDIRRCRYCYTDFQLEIEEVGDEALALVITKWLDLGSGLTPVDTKWRSHLARATRAEVSQLVEAGTIRLRFEEQPGLSQDAISCQNASYLTAERFRSAMDRWDYKTWILQGGQRLSFLLFLYSHRKFFLALLAADLCLILGWREIFFK
jgi:hypothetical protein